MVSGRRLASGDSYRVDGDGLMNWRFTKLLCAVLIGASVAAARSSAQSPDAPMPPRGISPQELEFWRGLTPDGWAKGAEGMPKCSVSSSVSDLVEQKWKTDSLEGVLSLPKDFREAPVAAGADGNRWIGADSSSVEIHGTHSLYRGGMGMGGMDIGRPLGTTACALTLEGRPAPSHKLQLTRPAHGDTLNVDTPNTVIRNAVGLQLVILTHTPAREAELLAAAQSLKVAGAKSP
jgi:hypothetical protein